MDLWHNLVVLLGSYVPSTPAMKALHFFPFLANLSNFYLGGGHFITPEASMQIQEPKNLLMVP